MTQTVMITGCAGFIGQNLVKTFSEDGWDVIGLDHDPSKWNSEFIGELPTDIRVVNGDVRNLEAVNHLAEKCDVCVHLAGHVDIPESINDPLNDFEHNVLGSMNVIEACRENDTKMVFTSSASVYGNVCPPIKESQMLRPISPYACSKVTVENYINLYRKLYRFNGTVLRLMNVYGPMKRKGVHYNFITRMINNDPLIVYGNGEQARDFIFVNDVTDAILKSVEAPNGIYNIGSGEPTTVNKLLSKIKDCINNGNPIKYEKKKKGEVVMSWCDNSLAREILDWRPRTNLDEGIKLTVEWIEEQIE